MKSVYKNLFSTVNIEGAIFTPEFLSSLVHQKKTDEFLTPESYHLSGEKINEAVSRSWQALKKSWEYFKAEQEKLSESDTGTTHTRDKWLLILFRELGYGWLKKANAIEIANKTCAISHNGPDSMPVHLVSYKLNLDKRTPKVAGAAQQSPHSLVQTVLNNHHSLNWGIVSNGLVLRLLKDSRSLTRQSYIEFDLQAMMNGEIYPDFVLLWVLIHQTRFEKENRIHPIIDEWFVKTAEQGVRALDELRQGVTQSIEWIGKGILSNSQNQELRNKLKNGIISEKNFYHQCLRVIYRILFLMTAEDRNLLLSFDTPQNIKDIYIQHYSLKRIRKLASQISGSKHSDLWEQLKVVFNILGGEKECTELGLIPLGSKLWTQPLFENCCIDNYHFLQAIRALAYKIENNSLHPVDFKNMGTEELGSVYESLLELIPKLDTDIFSFELKTVAGNERKTSGSYYTPSSLINSLLDTALEPVIQKALSCNDPQKAILDLKICDTACGSGHFLISASHRLAKRLAQIKTDEYEPAPESLREALREVISNCIYGVDINPMSVELCKVSLWLEAMVPGKPLSFLDHHIKCGNSLLGATPNLLIEGIPNEAFNAVTGDDKEYCTLLKRRNRSEHESLGGTLFSHTLDSKNLNVNISSKSISGNPDSIESLKQLEKEYEEFQNSDELLNAKLIANAWCASFLIPKQKEITSITHQVFHDIKGNKITSELKQMIWEISKQYNLFHFYLEFPEVFQGNEKNPQTGWNGGFDCILGNPPWERIKLQEKEWFDSRDEEIANAQNASKRKILIEKLQEKEPDIFEKFNLDKRIAEITSQFIRLSSKYPLCGRGDINTYSIFTELNRNTISSGGRMGIIVPSGIASDDTTKYFFQDIMQKGSLISLYDFENRKAIFPGVHRSYKFCLITIAGLNSINEKGADFAFFMQSTDDLENPDIHFQLTYEQIEKINPNTKTCPIFRNKKDAEITKTVYEKFPVLIKEFYNENNQVIKTENPWDIKFLRMFDMANDSNLFYGKEQLQNMGYSLNGNIFQKENQRFLPLYEAKMVHHYNHRFGDYEDLPEESRSTQLPEVSIQKLQNPNYSPLPRYWVSEEEVEKRIPEWWNHKWLMGWRDITNTTNERTMIAGIVPLIGFGNTFFLVFPLKSSEISCFLNTNFICHVFDYILRNKLGGTHLNYHQLKQLPVLPPETYEKITPWDKVKIKDWLLPRILELTYTADDMKPFAEDCGYNAPPFIYDEERRFLIRCEIDAAYFHLYQIKREDVDYIMDTFPIVKRKDESKYVEYKTKNTILKIYDQIQNAINSGKFYITILDASPASFRVANKE